MTMKWSTIILTTDKQIGNVSTDPYIARKKLERIDLLLDTHVTEYTRQTFYMSITFREVCIRMIMRLSNVQTKKYDLQAILHPVNCARHTQHSSDGNKNSFPGIYIKQLTEYDGTTTSDTTTENITAMGTIDISYLMMMITWVINISSLSLELWWGSETHTNPYKMDNIMPLAPRLERWEGRGNGSSRSVQSS